MLRHGNALRSEGIYCFVKRAGIAADAEAQAWIGDYGIGGRSVGAAQMLPKINVAAAAVHAQFPGRRP